jgi:S1-C subfamily serine protease
MNFVRHGRVQGRGAAVPVGTVSRVVNQIIKYGESFNPCIGVSTIFGAFRGLEEYGTGLWLARVVPNGPAFDAGLEAKIMQPGGWRDAIIGVDGRRIHSYRDFKSTLDAKQEGETIDLIVYRLNYTSYEENIKVVPVRVTTENHLDRKQFDKKTMSKKVWVKLVSLTGVGRPGTL